MDVILSLFADAGAWLTGNPALGGIIAALGAVVVGAVLLWLIASGLSGRWTRWRRRSELHLRMAGELYGTFSGYQSAAGLWRDVTGTPVADGARGALLARAAEVEGRCEALVLELCSELKLTRKELEAVAQFRRHVLALRLAIRDRKALTAGETETQALQASATTIAARLARLTAVKLPSEAVARVQLQKVTAPLAAPTKPDAKPAAEPPQQGPAVQARPAQAVPPKVDTPRTEVKAAEAPVAAKAGAA